MPRMLRGQSKGSVLAGKGACHLKHARIIQTFVLICNALSQSFTGFAYIADQVVDIFG